LSSSFPAPTAFTFGKYRGQDVTTVPVSYLVYLLQNARRVGPFIHRELERRAQESGRDAVEANAALARWRYELARNSRHKPRPPKQPIKKKRSSSKSSRERHRQASYRGTDKLKAGVDVVGEHFARLREEFAAAGGSLADTPFETMDYRYQGPAIDYAGERPVVRSPDNLPAPPIGAAGSESENQPETQFDKAITVKLTSEIAAGSCREIGPAFATPWREGDRFHGGTQNSNPG
jgi:hypothetical protein